MDNQPESQVQEGRIISLLTGSAVIFCYLFISPTLSCIVGCLGYFFYNVHLVKTKNLNIDQHKPTSGGINPPKNQNSDKNLSKTINKKTIKKNEEYDVICVENVKGSFNQGKESRRPLSSIKPIINEHSETGLDDVISSFLLSSKMPTLITPPEFGSCKYLNLESKFSNIDGGYSLIQVEDNGYGVWFDLEDSKYLYYNERLGQYLVADENGSRRYYCQSKKTQSKDPSLAEWDGLKVKHVDFKFNAVNTYDAEHHDDRFVDPEFEPTSINAGKKTGVVWVRGEAIRGSRNDIPKLFDGIEPTDISQGLGSDSWLIAAIAALAEFPLFIENELFVTKEYNPEGEYKVRLYDVSDQEFKEVVVDSLIPCKEKMWWQPHAKPMFAQPNGNELYMLILEKAIAKWAGR